MKVIGAVALPIRSISIGGDLRALIAAVGIVTGILGCTRRQPAPRELSPLTELARRLFRAEQMSDSMSARQLVSGDTALMTANGLKTRHPELVSDAVRLLRPCCDYELYADSAAAVYQVGHRISPGDLVEIRFVRRDSTWRISYVVLAEID
jgi:hypothetical protein